MRFVNRVALSEDEAAPIEHALLAIDAFFKKIDLQFVFDDGADVVDHFLRCLPFSQTREFWEDLAELIRGMNGDEFNPQLVTPALQVLKVASGLSGYAVEGKD